MQLKDVEDETNKNQLADDFIVSLLKIKKRIKNN